MKLHKASILYKGLGSRNFALALFLTFPLIAGSPGQTIAGLAILSSIMLFSVIYSYVYWTRYDYEITDDSFDIEKGVLRKKTREIPLHRIQNVDISSNLIQRLVGIAQVNLETAGGGDTEASLRFVGFSEAERIQKQIRVLKKEVKEEEDEVESESSQDDRELLFELDSKELTLLSLFTVDNRSVALIFFLFTLFAGNFWIALERLGASSFAIGTVMISLALLVVWIISSVRIFSKYYGFKLYKSDDVYEYERGLIQRYSGSIPEEKIQVIVLDENPLKRIFSYTTLRLETAGYSRSSSSEVSTEALVPLTTRKRAIELGKSIRKFEDIKMKGIPSRARYRYFARYMIVLSVLFVALVEFTILTRLTYIFAILLVVIAALGAHLKWTNKGYYRAEEHYITMNGFWRRQTVIMPYYRIQNIICSQTILQKKWRLSTVLLDTAGSGLLGASCNATDIDEKDAEVERKQILENFFKSLDKEN